MANFGQAAPSQDVHVQEGAGSRLNASWYVIVMFTSLVIMGIMMAAPVRPDGFDVSGYTLTAQSIAEFKTTRVDPILGHPTPLGSCGDSDCIIVRVNDRTYALIVRGQALYNFYPLGTSLVILPASVVAHGIGYKAVGVEARWFEYLLAAWAVTLSFLLSFALCRCYLSPIWSWIWSTGIVLASPFSSTMGSALWSSNYAVVCNLAAIILLVRRNKHQQLSTAGIAILFFMSYLCKPTGLITLVLVFIYLFITNRRMIFYYLFPCVLMFSIFIAYSFGTYGQVLPPYYSAGHYGFHPSLLGVWGVLASPSRGLFVYQPYLIVILALGLAYLRSLYKSPLFYLIITAIVGHIASVVSLGHWWGGFCYGSRMMTEVFPLILLFCVLVWQQMLRRKSNWLIIGITGVLLLAGMYINTGQGLYNPAVLAWNGISGHSFSINKDKEYLWSWRYPQFLASKDLIAARNQQAAAEQLEAALPTLADYQLGTRIFPDSRDVYYENWLSVERRDGITWRWASGPGASIWLRLPENAQVQSRFRLTIVGNPYAGYTVDLLLNKRYLGTITSVEAWPSSVYTFEFSGSDYLTLGAVNSIDMQLQQDNTADTVDLQRIFYIESLRLDLIN